MKDVFLNYGLANNSDQTKNVKMGLDSQENFPSENLSHSIFPPSLSSISNELQNIDDILLNSE